MPTAEKQSKKDKKKGQKEKEENAEHIPLLATGT